MKGRTFKLCVLTRWDFNFCVRSSPLRGFQQHRPTTTAVCFNNTNQRPLQCISATPTNDQCSVFQQHRPTTTAVCFNNTDQRPLQCVSTTPPTHTALISAIWTDGSCGYLSVVCIRPAVGPQPVTKPRCVSTRHAWAESDLSVICLQCGGGGTGFFLAREDLGRTFDHSLFLLLFLRGDSLVYTNSTL